MNTTRRLFSRWLGAAPLAIGAVAASPRGVAEKLSHSQVAGVTGLMRGDDNWKPTPEPPGLANYYNATGANQRSQRYMSMMKEARRVALNYGGLNANIQALKSVAPQHKLHMATMRELQRQEDERTFAEKLMDQFGVREYFSKHAQIEGNGAGMM